MVQLGVGAGSLLGAPTFETVEQLGFESFCSILLQMQLTALKPLLLAGGVYHHFKCKKLSALMAG